VLALARLSRPECVEAFTKGSFLNATPVCDRRPSDA
jgi:hypothetical protein